MEVRKDKTNYDMILERNNRMDIENKIRKILDENGIYISDNPNENLDLDSITFISIIVCLENELEIEVPDDYLLIDKFMTFNNYVDNVKFILGMEEEKQTINE